MFILMIFIEYQDNILLWVMRLNELQVLMINKEDAFYFIFNKIRYNKFFINRI